ncbi:hypothetical protein [Microbacterium sp. NPDC090003]|uniref:hypothetical protein n=1 Tax=Microbacterium sp. NPDC090003 TaxID=3364203 RepID=UPI003826E456
MTTAAAMIATVSPERRGVDGGGEATAFDAGYPGGGYPFGGGYPPAGGYPLDARYAPACGWSEDAGWWGGTAEPGADAGADAAGGAG